MPAPLSGMEQHRICSGKVRDCFASDTADTRHGLGTLSSRALAGKPCCSAAKGAPTLQAALRYQSNGFKLENNGMFVYLFEPQWNATRSLNDKLTPLKQLFIKLKVPLFRNIDDPYQYISNKVAASCFRLAFLSLLYHPFYLIMA